MDENSGIEGEKVIRASEEANGVSEDGVRGG